MYRDEAHVRDAGAQHDESLHGPAVPGSEVEVTAAASERERDQ